MDDSSSWISLDTIEVWNPGCISMLLLLVFVDVDSFRSSTKDSGDFDPAVPLPPPVSLVLIAGTRIPDPYLIAPSP